MHATHVSELQKFYFPNDELSKTIESLADTSRIINEKPNFEKKEIYQPATVIFLKTFIFTFFMVNKKYQEAEPLAEELIKMVESYNKWN